MFQVGDEVIRKSGRRVVGTIVRIYGTQARVRWQNALRPFAGGYSDNHTTVALTSLVPATDANRAKIQAQIAAKQAAAAAERAKWHYCPTCHTNMFEEIYCCRCDRAAWEQEHNQRQQVPA